MSEIKNLPCVQVALNHNDRKSIQYTTGVRHTLADIVDYFESQDVACPDLDYFRGQLAIVRAHSDEVIERGD